jgi:hypothetical protein
VLVVVVAAAVIAATGLGRGSQSASGYQPPAGPLPPVASNPLLPAPGVLFGAWVKPTAGFSNSDQESGIRAFEHAIGRKLAIDSLYMAWNDPMPVALARWDLRDGRIPMISWDGPPLAQVLKGAYDTQIRAQALLLKSLGGPVILRFFPEMNNHVKSIRSPAQFIAAWRYVHKIFTQAGATNVQWAWTPDSGGFQSGSAQRFYPGGAYVNWIGADGYNWAPGLPGASWRTFSEIFSAFYQWSERQGKPLLIGEFGSGEGSRGAKAAWFRQAARTLRTQFPRIRAIVYFNSIHENFGRLFDWKVTSSPSSLTAFRAFANEPYFNARD